MIVPQSRMLYCVGFTALPLSVIAALMPETFLPTAVIFGALLFVILSDAAMAQGLLDGIHIMLPEIIRLTKDREGKLPLEIENEHENARRLRLALALPPGFSSPHDDIMAILPAQSRRSRISWPCTPLKRGNYIVENIYLEARSPLGLWAIRRTAPARAEIRVYPNTMIEQKRMAALFLNRGMLGLHTQRQVGKGKEFEKLREYIPGDSYEDIHWKATARRGHPVTKVYQIERTQEVYVILDASRLSAREVEIPPPAHPGMAVEATTQLERFISTAMVLGLAAEQQRDLFGIFAFSDQVRTFIRAGNGKAHYGVCRDALYTLQSKRVNPDFGEICSFIRLRLRRRALLIFLTNLDDPLLAEGFLNNLDIIARHHLILVNMLPAPGVAPLFSNPDVAEVDDIYQNLGDHIQWQKLRELKIIMQRRGVSMNLLDNEMMSAQLISQYINIKRRQLL